ncbi:hypothetical protein N9N66_02630 [Schleiferiaceae bacterium]|nr:hypothetical protein [Schleiferiaceae bacterium]
MNQIITIKKDPVLLIYAGAVLLLVGSIGFVPFKFPQWQDVVYFFNLTFFSGILILLRCFQKIGWRLSLKGNVLYYQKFNLFSSWKKRRSAEFSLPIENITSARVKKNVIQIKYKPNRELQFKTRGMNPGSRSNLHPLLDALNEDI